MIKSEITLQVRLEIGTRRQGDVWVAWCPPLDVLSQAETKSKAIEALTEAVDLWFESCISRGVLDKALAEAGFRPAKDGQALARGSNLLNVHEKKHKSTHDAHRPRQTPRYISVSVPAYAVVSRLNAGATR